MKLCWLYRKAISWTVDSPSAPPRWIERHLGQCPGCRQFHHSEVRLIAALTSSADAPRPEFPPFLHARITHALHRESHSSRAALPFSYWIRVAFVPLLGVALAGGYLYWNAPHPVSKHPKMFSVNDYVNEEPVAEALPESDPSLLVAWAEKLDHPLETEMNSVVLDAKTAFKSLTENFLPR